MVRRFTYLSQEYTGPLFCGTDLRRDESSFKMIATSFSYYSSWYRISMFDIT
jgi:hypothetical protein